MRLIISSFLVAHGLVHLWFVVLSRNMIPFHKDMGWNAESWLLSKFASAHWQENIASLLFAISALLFVAAAVGFYFQLSSWRTMLWIASFFSSLTIFLFWDGEPRMLIEKGIIGLLINIGTIFLLLK